MVDFNELLDQARQGAPRSIFTPHMDVICDPKGFSDATQLRLLGNAIAKSPENAALLGQNEAAVIELLKIDPLGLQVLYNGTVENQSFSEQVLGLLMEQKDRVQPSSAMKNLLGSIWESTGGKIPREFVIQLVIDGFVELVVQDHSLETEPQIIANFKAIYNHCQKISMDAEDSDEFDSLGFRVIGNITSHREFGIEQASEVTEDPFTWETVILLGNLSAAKANIEKVLSKWPNLVEKTIQLIESEDPEDEDLEREDQDQDPEEEDEASADQIMEVGAEEEEDEEDPPFDLELWGGLIRNVSRDPHAAKQIAQYHPAKLFTRLLTSPNTQEVAGDFASAFSSNCYDHELTNIMTSEPHNGGSVLVTSSIVTGLSNETPSKAELDWALPRIAKTLIDGMLADSKEAVWIKGTKALAVIKAQFGSEWCTEAKRLQDHENAANSEPVKQNLKAILD